MFKLLILLQCVIILLPHWLWLKSFHWYGDMNIRITNFLLLQLPRKIRKLKCNPNQLTLQNLKFHLNVPNTCIFWCKYPHNPPVQLQLQYRIYVNLSFSCHFIDYVNEKSMHFLISQYSRQIFYKYVQTMSNKIDKWSIVPFYCKVSIFK